jgi:5-formaminoimidazole-4-carboxamide-1-beta-D-ribofuranosyl 5'-monophosphate synthetase
MKIYGILLYPRYKSEAHHHILPFWNYKYNLKLMDNIHLLDTFHSKLHIKMLKDTKTFVRNYSFVIIKYWDFCHILHFKIWYFLDHKYPILVDWKSVVIHINIDFKHMNYLDKQRVPICMLLEKDTYQDHQYKLLHQNIFHMPKLFDSNKLQDLNKLDTKRGQEYKCNRDM